MKRIASSTALGSFAYMTDYEKLSDYPELRADIAEEVRNLAKDVVEEVLLF